MKYAIRPIAIITLSLFGFLLIVSFYADRSDLELTGREMLEKVSKANYSITLADAKKMENVQLIDLRENHEFELSHPEAGVINIPLAAVLNDEYKGFFKNADPKVFLNHDPVKAHEVWMLLTQMGYENLFVVK